MSSINQPSRRIARRLTALGLVFLFLPILSFTPSASAAPGGGWGMPMDLKAGGSGLYGYDVSLAGDQQGGAMAVFTDWTGANFAVIARHYQTGFGWGPEVELETVFGAYIDLDTNAVGDSVVTWSVWNGSAYVPRLAVYSAFAGWGTVLTVPGLPGSVDQARVSIDGSGRGYAAFSLYNSTLAQYRLYGTMVGLDGTATTPVRLDNSTHLYYAIDMDSSAAAGAIVVWTGYNGTNYDVFSIRHNGTSWQARRLVEIRGGSANRAPQVGLDDFGTALVVWGQTVNYWQIWWATSAPTGGWSAAQYAYSNSDYFDLAMHPTGTAVMVTVPWNGSTNVMAASRYNPGQGFGTPSQSNFSWGFWDYPYVWLDSVGNAYMSAFDTSTADARIKVVVFQGAGSWTSQAMPEDPTFGEDEYGIDLAPLSEGTVLASWVDYDNAGGDTHVRTNLFRGTDTVPPWVAIDRVYDGQVTSATQVYVHGWSEPGSVVTINGAAVETRPSGQFWAYVPVTRGTQWIYASAIDATGNYAYSNSVLVTSTDPQLLLEAERAQAGRGGYLDPMSIESINYWGEWWPRVGADRNGNAFAIWYEYSGSQDHGYATRYQNGTGWGTPVLLQNNDGWLYGAPRMAVDAGGNATVVWATYDYDGAWSHVYAQFYSVIYGWQGPYRIDTAERFAWWPDVAVNPVDGNHYMVWHQRDENTLNYSIWSRAFVTSFTFTAAQRIESVSGTNELGRIAFDASGRGYVGFRNWNGTGNYNVGVARFNGATWNQSFILQNNTPNIWNVPVAVDAGGNATFVWRTWNGTYHGFAHRLYANGTGSGTTLVLGTVWDWDPEVLATSDGRAFVGFTADRPSSFWNGFVGVAGPGSNAWSVSIMDSNPANRGGGVKLSTNWDRTVVRAHFDEEYDGYWHGQMREYNVSNSSWGPTILLSRPGVGAHIPDVAPMPDGGMMVVWGEDNTTLGYSQTVARRITVYDTTPPALTVAWPVNGSTTNVSYTEVRGFVEAGARLWVNNVELVVAANNTFLTVVPLTNGTNTISVRAQDMNGVWRNITLTVTFADPALALIGNLTAQNQALQAQLNLTNSTLWAALNGQNASLAAAITAGDSALLAQLAAQNTSLLNAIAGLNASLLAQMAAEDSVLAQAIADTNSALLAELAAVNGDLLDAIADTNASLLASLAAQNNALLANIAATNASLLASLAAQNASVTAALANLNQTLLAELASQDAELTALIAATNASLLAELAAQNDALLGLIADTNASLLASLAVQNDDLLARIAATNASLLAELAAGDAALFAKLTANHGALWAQLNVTGQQLNTTTEENEETNQGQDGSISAAEGEAAAARAAASGASTMALLGILIGAAGVGVGALAFLASRKRPPQMDSSPPAPRVEEVSVVEPAPSGSSRGHSMGAEGELSGKAENEL